VIERAVSKNSRPIVVVFISIPKEILLHCWNTITELMVHMSNGYEFVFAVAWNTRAIWCM
jgi:hypothetical protein